MAEKIDVLIGGVGTGGMKMSAEEIPRGNHKK